MAKPRVFISSTYYDLRWIRNSVEQFIESMGFEATVFESGDVPFSHDVSLDISCYREITFCHVLVLIIGGRYGSPVSQDKKPVSATELEKMYAHYNSVTRTEYLTAIKEDVPIYVFVEKGVLAEYETYKNNREAKVKYAHVDSVNIFKLLDDIYGQPRNNLVREFATANDITSWLRDQWAGLFANYVFRRREEKMVGEIRSEIASLKAVVDALKTYSEVLVKNLNTSNSAEVIKQVHQELETKSLEARLSQADELRSILNYSSVGPSTIMEALRDARDEREFYDLMVTRVEIAAGEETIAFPVVSPSRGLRKLRHELGYASWPKVTEQAFFVSLPSKFPDNPELTSGPE